MGMRHVTRNEENPRIDAILCSNAIRRHQQHHHSALTKNFKIAEIYDVKQDRFALIIRYKALTYVSLCDWIHITLWHRKGKERRRGSRITRGCFEGSILFPLLPKTEAKPCLPTLLYYHPRT